MIKGLGLDIVQIDRIKNLVERWGDRFLHKIYTSYELEYCFEKNRPYQHLAARFAAKEAAFKMLGTRDKGISWHDFEVRNNKSGAPKLILGEKAYFQAQKQGIKNIHLSISHERKYACAQVIGEG